jgi:hypothetical protein
LGVFHAILEGNLNSHGSLPGRCCL